MKITNISKWALISLLSVGSAAALSSCSSEGTAPSTDESNDDSKLSRVDLNLNVPEGHTVDSIHYEIFAGTDTDGTPPAVEIADTDVSSELATGSAFVYLAPGQYTIVLSATAQTGDIPCAGQATFTVTAGTNANVSVALTCIDPNAPVTGGAEINATFTFDHPTCGLTEVFVGPLVQAVTGSELITVKSEATMGATFAWSVAPATLGTFAAPSAADTTFDCTDAGPGVLTVTVANPAQACTETKTVEINCAGSDMCGDGTIGPTEQCEPAGNPNCNPTTCDLYVCGDGTVDPNEACDDNNTNNLDGCSNLCVVNFCGDGVVNNGEECDPVNGTTCLAGCLLPVAATCSSCASTSCAAEVAECDDTFNVDSGGVNRCRNIMTCHETSNCSQAGQPIDCFCGTATGTACISAPNGACLPQYLHGYPVPNTPAGVDGSALDAGLAFIDPDYAIGDANNLAACLETNCQASCNQY